MKEVQEYEKDLASIRHIMERSVKFISLSGLSGVLAGCYAVAGAFVAYFTFHYPRSIFSYRITSISNLDTILKLVVIATLVLIASLLTGYYFSVKKAKKYHQQLWSATTKRLVINMSIPLVTGGIFVLILLYSGHYGVAAPACLIFYGLALMQGSANLYDEIRYLGLSEIALGLVASIVPGFGLVFWTIGFGALHIVYGAVMHYRYDREKPV